MKKTHTHFLFFCCFVLAFSNCFSQTTIVLQPDETTSKDAGVWNIYPTTNYANGTDFIATAWTHSGSLSIIRSLIDFDLSGIPANSTILSATLSLHYHSSSSNIGHSQLSGSNACWLKRIISPWDESTVTWNNQPNTTPQNEVNIPASLNDTMSYPNIDVTALITDIYNSPSTSYGMELLLQTEQNYRSLLFATSAETNAALRPKLIVTYVPSTPTNDTCITLNCTEKGKDASVWNIQPTTNGGTDYDFVATAWTWSGSYSCIRGLMEFDLSPVPSYAIITSATLNLHYHTSTSNTGHSTLSGSNDAWLRRVTSPWDEMTVTWNTQPTYSLQNQVYLPETTSDTMSYPNIDVTNLIEDIWNNPTSGYGFIFMLNTETQYRSMLFASSDEPDITKRPKLTICYTYNASLPENNLPDNNITLYPNPASDQLSVDYSVIHNSDVEIAFYSVTGKQIDQIKMGYETTGKHNLKYIFNPDLYPTGIYLVKISTSEGIMTKRFLKMN